MAFNYRRQGLISSENTTMPGKNIITKGGPSLVKRQALGEIKNQIHNANNREGLKKQPSVTGQKRDIKITKTTSSSSIVTHKETKKLPTAASKQDNEKAISAEQTSENLINRIETICVIKNDDVRSYSTQRFEPIDEKDESDPQLVVEYINDIFEYLRSLEVKYSIDELFLAGHRTTNRMRCVLVNWLVEVHSNFNMLSETLHLCIQILDRYLQKIKTIGRDNLQLVGITALWIAGKYEEMYIPEIGDFTYIADDCFTADEMKSMELSIMRALDCSFGRPLSLHFLRRYSKVSAADSQQYSLAKYFIELALLYSELSFIRPSLQAAAAYFLSYSVLNNCLNHRQVWTNTLIHYSTYSFSDLEKTVKQMAGIVIKVETSKFQAVRSKYSTPKFAKISLCPELKGPVIFKYSQK